MELTTAVISFAGGVGVAVVAAFAAGLVRRRLEAKRRIEEARFDVYMKLLELQGLYHWIAVAELRAELPQEEVLRQVKSLAWQIADKLRSADEIEHLSEILAVLLSRKYTSAASRSEALDQLLHELGATVNPRYANAVRQISEENLLALREDPEGLKTRQGFLGILSPTEGEG
jgi:hypothetical protein